MAITLGLGLVVVSGWSSRAEETPGKQIAAGPFSVVAPVAWAGGAVVEKVPILPVYTAQEWKEYRAAEEKIKISPKEPSRALKPGYSNRPTHWAIRFPKLVIPGKEFDLKQAGDDATAPQILIHRAEEWSGVYQDGKFDEAAVKKTAKKLRLMIEEQDPKKDPAYQDAELGFIVEKKALRFSGGRGFRVLAQWDFETDLLRQGDLHYLFLGLSDDGSCQIIATFPIDLPGLPEGGPKAEHLGFSMARYAELSKQFPKYQKAAKAWLTANAAQARPALTELDAMMSSLVVQKWE